MGKYKIKIIYEDNHLLVVEKPVNIPVQEDNSKDDDLLSILKQDLKVRYNKPHNVYLGLVHRLDRPVGGVIVFAKTSKCASRLSEQIRTREFGKKYLAVAHKKFKREQGELKNFLYKDKAKNIVKVVDKAGGEAKLAVLDYNALKYVDNLSLVEINLETGRPHQIRVQLAHIGHPLWGDQKYGSDVNVPGQQIALWSTELSFEHPISKEYLTFKSPAPNESPWNKF